MSESDLVWRALADPTRRAILDLLRVRPHTTSQLNERIALTRFGVMKHLATLENAGLVISRKDGRERWNHLNVVPLQRAYDRWMSPYAAQWAQSLLKLKTIIETEENERPRTMSTSTPETQSSTVGSFHIEQEVFILSTPSSIFRALTRDVGSWWGEPYLTGPESCRDLRKLQLEDKLGGKFCEDYGNGDGAIWGTVSELRRDQRIEITGPCGMAGAVYGVFSFSLESAGDLGTKLSLSHRAIGDVLDKKAMYVEGWQDLLGTRLKGFVESQATL